MKWPALVLAGFAAAASAAPDPQPSGKIVMYRPGAMFGAVMGCPIRYNGKEIVELGRGKFAEWDVPAGSYALANKSSKVTVEVASGQTKYVRCYMKMGVFGGRATLEEVGEDKFAEHSSDFERKEIAVPVGIGS
jgi:hypothetical protein